jgi:hypothetical protein
MPIQKKWDEMCEAYANGDWGRLGEVAGDLRQRLDKGETPIVDTHKQLGKPFQLALAKAGVEFVLERLFVRRHHA